MWMTIRCLMSAGAVAWLASGSAGADCFSVAAQKYGIARELLQAIAKVESALDPLALRINRGSYDIGIMQVNSRWLPLLRRHGIQPADLYDACTNIDVGSWILANEIARHGYTWTAVGFYHSPTRARQRVYTAKVARALGPP
jgi:soluble lytic murein transglycosylase-like protein